MTSKKKSNIVIGILSVLTAAALIILAVNLYSNYTHPIKYSDTVNALAAEHGVDNLLIYAVIKTESGFNPDAESGAGARGLMQIMPETFEWIRWRWFPDDDLDFDDMFEPEINIRYGVRLISYHMENYNNNVENSLAAYHAGDGAVNEWLNDKRYSQNGRVLDEIPIPETAHYVNKVNKAHKVYTKKG